MIPECEAKYIGQTKQKIKTRFKDHHDDIRKDKSDEKPLAAHEIIITINLEK